MEPTEREPPRAGAPGGHGQAGVEPPDPDRRPARSTDQEVGFAEAQFGEGQAAPYRKALDDAKALLRDAFALSQQLDDDTPETPCSSGARCSRGVIDKCSRPSSWSPTASRVKALRDLVKNVDQVLPQTTQLVQAQTARLEAAQHTIAELAQRYQAENVQAVTGNAGSAQQKLAGATAALAAGQAALAANDRDTAVTRVQEAETAVAEAKALLDAVDQTKQDLAKGETDLQTSMAAVDQDIAQARSALAAGKSPERGGEVERAATLLAKARELATATPVDLVAATRAATEANTAIDAVLAGIQQVDAAAQRNAAAASAAIANASASVSQAQGLLEAYGSSAAGRRASTRIAQANQYLARARASSAPTRPPRHRRPRPRTRSRTRPSPRCRRAAWAVRCSGATPAGAASSAARRSSPRGRGQRHDGQHPGASSGGCCRAAAAGAPAAGAGAGAALAALGPGASAAGRDRRAAAAHPAGRDRRAAATAAREPVDGAASDGAAGIVAAD
ncbi:MAG: hypothetical protein R3C32_05180 [Chloroflexota bacterium]